MEIGFMNRVVKRNLTKMFRLTLYRFFVVLCGLPVFLVTSAAYLLRGDKDQGKDERQRINKKFHDDGTYSRLETEISEQLRKKYSFLKKNPSQDKMSSEQNGLVSKRFNDLVEEEYLNSSENAAKSGFVPFFLNLLDNQGFRVFSVILGFPMYFLVFMFSNPYVKYITERLFMMVFVIFGVTFLVFTILYMSPMDPAKNILGPTATEENIEEFNRVYGLDKPYHEQLFKAFKGIVTFDVGNSYMGNEDVMSAISRRFPITLTITFWSLLMALILAIPAGIFSAIRPYSAFDYVFMLIALLGISIPNFWLGLIMILNFSINSKILPSLYVVGNMSSIIMPVIILGTDLAASVARMTRSSMLEVIKQDYVTTARAKGLPESKVVLRHVLGNAMIPIVTVLGLQFGGMLGGSSVTEKVFNVNGLGSFIVDKQFIPDIPVVLAATVYIAIVISITNLFVDILYAFLDPRIKSRMKNY